MIEQGCMRARPCPDKSEWLAADILYSMTYRPNYSGDGEKCNNADTPALWRLKLQLGLTVYTSLSQSFLCVQFRQSMWPAFAVNSFIFAKYKNHGRFRHLEQLT